MRFSLEARRERFEVVVLEEVDVVVEGLMDDVVVAVEELRVEGYNIVDVDGLILAWMLVLSAKGVGYKNMYSSWIVEVEVLIIVKI
jgi:hypothetical protein